MKTTVNTLVGKLSERAGELAAMKMDELRSIAGYGCESRAESIRVHKHESRSSLVSMVLLEEFSVELDTEIETI